MALPKLPVTMPLFVDVETRQRLEREKWGQVRAVLRCGLYHPSFVKCPGDALLEIEVECSRCGNVSWCRGNSFEGVRTRALIGLRASCPLGQKNFYEQG